MHWYLYSLCHINAHCERGSPRHPLAQAWTGRCPHIDTLGRPSLLTYGHRKGFHTRLVNFYRPLLQGLLANELCNSCRNRTVSKPYPGPAPSHLSWVYTPQYQTQTQSQSLVPPRVPVPVSVLDISRPGQTEGHRPSPGPVLDQSTFRPGSGLPKHHPGLGRPEIFPIVHLAPVLAFLWPLLA